MNTKNILAALIFSFALTGFAGRAQAQLGTGWVEYKPERKIHLVDSELPIRKGMKVLDWAPKAEVGSNSVCASYVYDKATDSETFKLHDKRSNRAEIRLQNDYGEGTRQFEGYVTFFGPLNDESLFQVWGSDEGATQMMIRGYAADNGSIRINNAVVTPAPLVATNCYGREIKVNVIHHQDDVGGMFYVYLDGKKVLEFKDGENATNNNGKNYHKYGVYGTLKTPEAVAKWRAVRHFKDGRAPESRDVTTTR